MKATRLYGPGDLRLEEVPVPEIGPHEVLIKVHVDGLCPTGVHAVERGRLWGEPGIGFPGHEFAGEVVAVGPHVKDIKVGDRVVGELLIKCGRCYYCRIGKSNLCLNSRWVGYFSWAEYVKTYDFAVYKIPDNVSNEAATFTEPLSCCLNAIMPLNIRPGDDVLIIGSGPMGLLLAQLAMTLKGARVIVSDINDKRLEFAAKFNIRDRINPLKENQVEKVKELTDGLGASAVIVTVGDTKVQEEAMKLVRPGGVVNFFAGVHGVRESLISINSNLVHYGEVTVTGSFDKTSEHFMRALKLISIGAVKVEELITHKFPLDDVHKAMEVFRRREGIKIMIYP